MASHPGDSTSQGALVPLKFVSFNQATSVPGCSIMMTTVEAKARRLVGGSEFICPQPFLNRTDRTVVIEDREYPLERVHFYVRAKMAVSKDPAPEDRSDYTIGKRAPARLIAKLVEGKPVLTEAHAKRVPPL